MRSSCITVSTGWRPCARCDTPFDSRDEHQQRPPTDGTVAKALAGSEALACSRFGRSGQPARAQVREHLPADLLQHLARSAAAIFEVEDDMADAGAGEFAQFYDAHDVLIWARLPDRPLEFEPQGDDLDRRHQSHVAGRTSDPGKRLFSELQASQPCSVKPQNVRPIAVLFSRSTACPITS